MSAPYLDTSVYPDLDPSELLERLDTEEQKADYVERICSAWDFDIYPEPETFALLREWKPIFDRCPLARLPHVPASVRLGRRAVREKRLRSSDPRNPRPRRGPRTRPMFVPGMKRGHWPTTNCASCAALYTRSRRP